MLSAPMKHWIDIALWLTFKQQQQQRQQRRVVQQQAIASTSYMCLIELQFLCYLYVCCCRHCQRCQRCRCQCFMLLVLLPLLSPNCICCWFSQLAVSLPYIFRYFFLLIAFCFVTNLFYVTLVLFFFLIFACFFCLFSAALLLQFSFPIGISFRNPFKLNWQLSAVRCCFILYVHMYVQTYISSLTSMCLYRNIFYSCYYCFCCCCKQFYRT